MHILSWTGLHVHAWVQGLRTFPTLCSPGWVGSPCHRSCQRPMLHYMASTRLSRRGLSECLMSACRVLLIFGACTSHAVASMLNTYIVYIGAAPGAGAVEQCSGWIQSQSQA